MPLENGVSGAGTNRIWRRVEHTPRLGAVAPADGIDGIEIVERTSDLALRGRNQRRGLRDAKDALEMLFDRPRVDSSSV